MNIFDVYNYITKAENHHFIFFRLKNYKKYKWLIKILIRLNKNYKGCTIYRVKYRKHKNIVVVGLRYYGRNVKRRTNGYAKSFLTKRKDIYCPYCGDVLNYKNITADHIVPISKGGSNAKINLMVCCKKCNEDRGDEEFYRYLKRSNIKYKDMKYPFL